MRRSVPSLLVVLLVVWHLLVPSVNAAAELQLAGSTYSLEVVSSSTAATDWVCSATDMTSPPAGLSAAGQISTATTTTVVSAPSGSTVRKVTGCHFRNTSTSASQTLTVQVDISTTNRTIGSYVLAPGWTLTFAETVGWQLLDNAGRAARITTMSDVGYEGRTFPYGKASSAYDAAGYWIWHGKDAGFPGAYSLGSPGVNGETMECDVAGADEAQIGAHTLRDPASGNLYLVGMQMYNNVIANFQLIDVLWVNTGLNVTTTTLQAIDSGNLPARDLNGSSDGEGYQLAISCTTACTNAATISNTTATYTDQSGNTGNTATFSAVVGWQAPATPVIGTWMPFQLAAGDRGIRKFSSGGTEGITLGTSYAGGAISAVIYRPLVTLGVNAANASTTLALPAPGIRIYPDSCISLISVAPATTAINPMGSYKILERP
jgi:hypothetical protein